MFCRQVLIHVCVVHILLMHLFSVCSLFVPYACLCLCKDCFISLHTLDHFTHCGCLRISMPTEGAQDMLHAPTYPVASMIVKVFIIHER